MYILTVAGKESEGAYSVPNADGSQILYLWEEEDDATLSNLSAMKVNKAHEPSMKKVKHGAATSCKLTVEECKAVITQLELPKTFLKKLKGQNRKQVVKLVRKDADRSWQGLHAE